MSECIVQAYPSLNSKIEMSEFKKIFYMEWAHRIAGRTLGLVYAFPTAMLMIASQFPQSTI